MMRVNRLFLSKQKVKALLHFAVVIVIAITILALHGRATAPTANAENARTGLAGSYLRQRRHRSVYLRILRKTRSRSEAGLLRHTPGIEFQARRALAQERAGADADDTGNGREVRRR